MDSENDGAIWRAFLLALSVLAIMIGVAACGAPVIDRNGLSWDNSLWANREAQRTERERMRLNAETRQAIEREETARIMSDNMMTTIQWFVVGGVVVGAIGLAAWATQRSVTAWAARPHRPAAPPQQIIVMAHPHLMAQGPDARLEWVEEDDYRGWAIVNDRLLTVRPLQLTDSRRQG